MDNSGIKTAQQESEGQEKALLEFIASHGVGLVLSDDVLLVALFPVMQALQISRRDQRKLCETLLENNRIIDGIRTIGVLTLAQRGHTHVTIYDLKRWSRCRA